MTTGRELAADLDPGRWRGRKIWLTRYQRYTYVELNRDYWVDANPGADKLPDDYAAALERCREAAINRLWVDGYTGGFGYGTGGRFIVLFMPHAHVKQAVTALKAAEMRGDIGPLWRLAAKLAPPLDDWLSPGERRLSVGSDFTCSPSQMLTFLRGEARRRGLRLNGRTDGPYLWIEPTRDALQSLVREVALPAPDPYPLIASMARRPDPGPRRRASRSTPVRFVDAARVGAPGDCPCGGSSSDNHDRLHMLWREGVPIPKTAFFRREVAVVETTTPRQWRKLAYECARVAKRDGGYDFSSFDSPAAEPEPSPDRLRAYLFRAGGRAVGFLSVMDSHRNAWLDFAAGKTSDAVESVRPRVNLIFVAERWRRQGVATSLVTAMAEDSGVPLDAVSWGMPFTREGRKLAGSLHPAGAWIS